MEDERYSIEEIEKLVKDIKKDLNKEQKEILRKIAYYYIEISKELEAKKEYIRNRNSENLRERCENMKMIREIKQLKEKSKVTEMEIASLYERLEYRNVVIQRYETMILTGKSYKII